MAWKSSFRQNYRTTFSPTVPPSAAGISHVMADVEAPGGEKLEHLKSGEGNGKLPLRTCPGCSVPEPYQSPDWSLVRIRRIFKGEKILSTPSFGGEVKPSVPCRRFAACKKFLNGVEVVISAKLPDNLLAHSSHFCRLDISRHGGRGGTWWWNLEHLKSGGKQWQATPKNLPRMQRTRAIPVAWLSSGLCPDRSKSWIPILIITGLQSQCGLGGYSSISWYVYWCCQSYTTQYGLTVYYLALSFDSTSKLGAR